MMTDKFINTFYDKNFTERDSKILDKLWEILQEINFNYIHSQRICFISIYGSQNYELDNKNSDIDCECFIFPSIEELAMCKTPYSTTVKTSYGVCQIKDIRKAIMELYKSSPNMIELIASKYNICNKDYLYLIQTLHNHCDDIVNADKAKYLKGLNGLFHKYASDAKLNNKYYANTLRISKMIDLDSYLDNIVLETNNKLDTYFQTHDFQFDLNVKNFLDHFIIDIINKYLKLNL